LKTIKNQFALIVGIALVLGLARVGAQAEDTTGGGATAAAKPGRPERPPRPDKPDGSGKGNGVNSAELKTIIKNFQDERKEFLKQQKEQQADQRDKVREELTQRPVSVGHLRQEAKDSVAELKQQSREQARKLAEEAKNAGKDHRRD
jgi:hypothetical protein